MKLSEDKVFVDPEATLAKVRPLWESEFFRSQPQNGKWVTLFLLSRGSIRTFLLQVIEIKFQQI